MVVNLLQAGFEVSVFNRTKEKEAPLLNAGAKSASSLQELMKTCDVVLTMLSNDSAVKEVFEEPTCLLSKTNSGKTIINMSTVAPETSRYLNTICKQHHVHFIDAPASASVPLVIGVNGLI